MIANYLRLVAKKCGMSQVIINSEVVPVTILHVEDMYIVGIKTKAKHGYNALIIGAGKVKSNKVNKPQKAIFEACSVPHLYKVKEFKLPGNADMSVFKIGEKIPLDLKKVKGLLLDITCHAKGKGFAGVVKKYGFGGQLASHGESLSERSLGSTGNRTDPGKVFKNKKMPGRMGGKLVTTQNLEVVDVNCEKSLIIIRGSIPGFKSSFCYLSNAIKKVITLKTSKEIDFNFTKVSLLESE